MHISCAYPKSRLKEGTDIIAPLTWASNPLESLAFILIFQGELVIPANGAQSKE